MWAADWVSWRRGWDSHPRLRGISPTSLACYSTPTPRHRTANAIRRHGFFGGGAAFTGIAFGAAAFLGFFFSLVRELFTHFSSIVVTSIPD